MTQSIAPTSDYLATTANYHHLIHMLSAALPPPLDPSAEALDRRDKAAIAQVASLCPVTAAEATLAADYVALRAHGTDCLRLAGLPQHDIGMSLRCRSQAVSMMRQAQYALRELRRIQADRIARDANAEAADQAAWAEHIASRSLTNGLTPAPNPPDPDPSWREPDEDEAVTEAAVETYAHLYPQRAALIRRHRGLPPNVTFGPPDPAMVEALVQSRSPILLALDEPKSHLSRL